MRRYCKDIIQYARKHSPYYRDLYKNVTSVDPSLEELPVTDSERYWELAPTPTPPAC